MCDGGAAMLGHEHTPQGEQGLMRPAHGRRLQPDLWSSTHSPSSLARGRPVLKKSCSDPSSGSGLRTPTFQTNLSPRSW